MRKFITSADLEEIKKLYNERLITVKKIAEQFGISDKHVYTLVRRGRRSDLPSQMPPQQREKISVALKEYHRSGLRKLNTKVRKTADRTWRTTDEDTKIQES